MIKVGRPGTAALPVPVPPEKFTVTRNGETYLSDTTTSGERPKNRCLTIPHSLADLSP